MGFGCCELSHPLESFENLKVMPRLWSLCGMSAISLLLRQSLVTFLGCTVGCYQLTGLQT